MYLLRWLGVIVVGMVLFSGCGREEEPKKKAPTGVGPEPQAPSKVVTGELPTKTPKLTSADDRDDPQYSLMFPASEKVEDWIKTEPVQGADGKDIGKFLPELASVLKPFRPELVAATTYQRFHDNLLETIRACLVRAPSTEDAYGMLTVSCPGKDLSKIGDLWRRARPDEAYVIRGSYFGIFTCEFSKAATRKPTAADRQHLIKGLERLAGKTMFDLPGRGGQPTLVKMFQTEKMPAAQTFFLRDLASLDGPAGSELVDQIGLNEPARMNSLLKLGPEVQFALAAFEVKDWPGHDVVWLAKYPSPEQALKVYQDYREVLRKAAPDPDGIRTSMTLAENTMLKPPRGKFLLGCWTVEAEPLTSPPFLMLRIHQALP